MNELESLMTATRQGNLDDVAALITHTPALINQHDSTGATALHWAAFHGHRSVAEWLIAHGANINAIDGEYHATPSGWAIEYLRERGGLLGIEIDDFTFAVATGDLVWVDRFLKRFPGLRYACAKDGTSFAELAERSPNPQIATLFAAQV